MYLIAWTIPYMPYIEYELNKKYIAEVLCENKDKPEMHCNGHCHLKKQLKKANAMETDQKQEAPPPPPLKSDPVIALIKNTGNNGMLPYKVKKAIVPYIVTYHFEMVNKVFHPPKS